MIYIDAYYPWLITVFFQFHFEMNLYLLLFHERRVLKRHLPELIEFELEASHQPTESKKLLHVRKRLKVVKEKLRNERKKQKGCVRCCVT